MNGETDRLLKWLTAFVGAVALLGVLCGLGIPVYGIIQQTPLEPDYTTKPYETIGRAIVFGSLAIAFLWGIFVSLYRAKSSGSSWWRALLQYFIGLAFFFAVYVALTQFKRVTDDLWLRVLFGLAIVFISVGIGRLWQSRG